jgi:hypothetical protein
MLSNMDKFKDTLKKVLPIAIKEFNEIRLPALETAWGRCFQEEWENEDSKHKTSEITKVYTRVINNTIYKHLKQEKELEFQEHGTDGSDFIINGIPIEDKNSFSDSESWTGNGYKKTDIHLLKKFKINDQGKIESVFAMIVDLSLCISKWPAPTTSSNFSSLKFVCEDETQLQVILGSLQRKKKYLSVSLQKI